MLGGCDCQDGGSGTVLVGTEDKGLLGGHPMGPQKHTPQDAGKKDLHGNC